jgi:hypothetical protein
MTTTGQRHELYLSWCNAQDTADNAIGKPWYNALVEDARAAWELLQAAVADAARTMAIDAAGSVGTNEEGKVAMTKTKLTPAQTAVLKRLAAGDSVTYQFNNHYLFDNGEQANYSTVQALKKRGLIYRSGVGRGDMPRYSITETGRQAQEESE